MSDFSLPLLQQIAVAGRLSRATRAVLEERAHPPAYVRFLDEDALAMLRAVVDVILPQDRIGTGVDVAEMIDRRLAEGGGDGWRYADLPEDGEAYRQGLTLLQKMLEATPMRSLEHMPVAAREGYLRCVANGDVDGAAHFPLSKFVAMLRADAVRMWMAHPSTMLALRLYSFADGVSGATDGPTDAEGWVVMTPNTAEEFERRSVQAL